MASDKHHNNPHLELPSESSSPRLTQYTLPNNTTTFPPVYPKVPYQDEPPSYDASTSGSVTPFSGGLSMPQPGSYQQQQITYPPPPGPPPPLNFPHQHCHPHQHSYPPQPITNNNGALISYGSVAPPNAEHAHLPVDSNSNAIVEPLTTLKTKTKLVQCPHCQQVVYTKLDHGYGACTGVSVASLFCLGCHPFTIVVPFLFPWFQDVIHKCPSCNERIAKFTRLDRQLHINTPAFSV